MKYHYRHHNGTHIIADEDNQPVLVTADLAVAQARWASLTGNALPLADLPTIREARPCEACGIEQRNVMPLCTPCATNPDVTLAMLRAHHDAHCEAMASILATWDEARTPHQSRWDAFIAYRVAADEANTIKVQRAHWEKFGVGIGVNRDVEPPRPTEAHLAAIAEFERRYAATMRNGGAIAELIRLEEDCANRLEQHRAAAAKIAILIDYLEY